MKNYNRIKRNTARRRQLFPNNRKGKKLCSDGPDADYGMVILLILICFKYYTYLYNVNLKLTLDKYNKKRQNLEM